MIKDALEAAFGVPFETSAGHSAYSWIQVTPTVFERGQGFSVRITNRANVRLVAEFIPQDFSANLIARFQEASVGNKGLFSSRVRLQLKHGASVVMKIDSQQVDPCDWNTWPSHPWHSLSFSASSTFESKEPSIIESTIEKWAILVTGAFLGFIEQVDEIDSGNQQNKSVIPATEGDPFSVTETRYERSRLNRTLCIQAKGTSCAVCGMDFGRKYGSLGAGFIQVHHLIPVSVMGPGFQVDPERDLIPVCPNCHAMLHRRSPPFAPEELKAQLSDK